MSMYNLPPPPPPPPPQYAPNEGIPLPSSSQPLDLSSSASTTSFFNVSPDLIAADDRDALVSPSVFNDWDAETIMYPQEAADDRDALASPSIFNDWDAETIMYPQGAADDRDAPASPSDFIDWDAETIMYQQGSTAARQYNEELDTYQEINVNYEATPIHIPGFPMDYDYSSMPNDYTEDGAVDVDDDDDDMTCFDDEDDDVVFVDAYQRPEDLSPAAEALESRVALAERKLAEVQRELDERIQRTRCPICFDDLLGKTSTVLQCGHLCCQECVYAIQDGRCPSCRSDFNYYYNVYFP